MHIKNSKDPLMRFYPERRHCGTKHLPLIATIAAGAVATTLILLNIKKISSRLHSMMDKTRKATETLEKEIK